MGVNIFLSDVINQNNLEYERLMFEAIRDGHLDLIKFFLSMNINKEIRNELGETLLIVAVKNIKPKIVKFLLDQNADVNAVDYVSKTSVFQFACYTGNKDIIDLVLAKNPDIHYRNLERIHAIMLAVIQSKIEVINYLIEDVYNNYRVLAFRDCKGFNALNYALEYRRFELFHYLANKYKKAIYNTDNKNRNLLIHAIIKDAPVEITRFLLELLPRKRRDIYNKNAIDYMKERKVYNLLLRNYEANDIFCRDKALVSSKLLSGDLNLKLENRLRQIKRNKMAYSTL